MVELIGEIFQRVEKEAEAVVGAVGVVVDLFRSEDEAGDDDVGVVEGVDEPGIVLEAEVAAKEEKRFFHVGYIHKFDFS